MGTPLATTRQLRLWLLAVITLDLALIIGRVLFYNPIWAQPGALLFVLEPVVLLLAYAGIMVAATANPSADRLLALRYGVATGLITGIMWIANLSLEVFTDLSGLASILSTAPFLLGAFVLWGVASALVAWRTGSVGSGVLAAIWSGMTCVLVTITFGFSLTYTSLPRLEQILATDPDFIRSHWTDQRAFAIANSFDSGFSHLLGALLIGTLVGTIGSYIGMFASSRTRRHVTP
jgi:hypothetical protein